MVAIAAIAATAAIVAIAATVAIRLISSRNTAARITPEDIRRYFQKARVGCVP